MINYSDFTKMLFPYNFIGGSDGLTETSDIPNDQTVNITGGKYVITYSFLKSYSDILSTSYYDSGSEEAEKFIGVSDYQQNIEDAFKNIIFATSVNNPQYVWFQEVANITFSETSASSAGMMAIGQLEEDYSNYSITTTAVTLPYNPILFSDSPELKHGDIFFNANNDFWDGSIGYKTQQFKVLLEEALHSLGVDSRTTEAVGTYLNNQKYSVAAYQNDYAPGMYSFLSGIIVAPHTLQIMDIAALQEIYGRNYSSFSGNTNYTLSVMNPSANDAAFLYTIWDGGGVDVIDVSASSASAEIDLRQGRFSSIGYTASGLFEIAKDANASGSDPDPGNVAIAYYTVIENAIGTDQDDIIIGNAWDNVINGGGGDDHLYGDGFAYDSDAGEMRWESSSGNLAPSSDSSGNDTLFGDSGDDVLYGGYGSDILHGGAGDDRADYSALPIYLKVRTINEALGNYEVDKWYNGSDPMVDPADGMDTLYSIEDFVVPNPALGGGFKMDGYGGFVIMGNQNNNNLSNPHMATGQSIFGLGGNDSIKGHNGYSNYLDGGDGNDNITGGSAGDKLLGGAGNDTMDGVYGDDYLDGGEGDDTVGGGRGNDLFIYTSGNDIFTPGTGNQTYNIDTLRMSAFALSDIVFSRQGTSTDILMQLSSGATVTLKQQNHLDRGIDILELSDGTYNIVDIQVPVYGTAAGETLRGTNVLAASIDDLIYGYGGDDNITAGDGNNVVYGGDGNDGILGGNDSDLFYGEAGNDNLNGGNGNDFLFGGDGNDTLQGGNGADMLYGGDGDDILSGGYQDDFMSGGAGNDTLSGSRHNDTYFYTSGNDIFSENLGNGIDTVEFDVGIDINDLLFSKNGNDLIINVAGAGTITLDEHYRGGGYAFEILKFDDNSTIDISTIVV